MQRLSTLIVIVAVASVVAGESKWVWQKNHRNHRAFDSSDGDKYGNSFYDREKDREPTTRRPSTAQPSDEDLLSPDDLRNYNGPFGYPAGANNYPPGYVPPTGPSGAQTYPNTNTGYPLPNGQGQPNYPTGPGGYGYPAPVPGGYPPSPANGFQAQGSYPNQGPGQGYYPPGPFPGQQGGGYPAGFNGYPGLGNIFGFGGGLQGQGGFPGQNPVTGPGGAPNLSGNPGAQGGYFYPFGPYPSPGGVFPNQQGIPGQQGYLNQLGIAGQQGFPNQPTAPGQQGYPNQQGFPNQPTAPGQQGFPNQPTAPGQQGFPNQYPAGNYPQPQPGQFPGGQYINCRQFGFPICPGPQQGQFPPQYPGQGQYPGGQYPVPDPNGSYNANPYGITPYNRGGGYAAAFDDYDEMTKNATVGANRALKPDGKSFHTSTPAFRTSNDKGHKKT